MTVGDRIRFYRERAGLTQTKLAQRVDVAQNTISGWETNRTEPSLQDFIRLAEALAVDISILQLGDESQHAHKIRVMGFIGAGQAVEPLASGDPLEYIEAPPGTPAGAEAAIVRGGSMYPLLRDGFTLIWWRWTPDPTPHVGELCVCKLQEGGMVVKLLESGQRRGLWTLQSLAAGFEPLRNVRLQAVAPVEIIYRANLSL